MSKSYRLEEILTEGQVATIVKLSLGTNDWKLVNSEVKPAVDGLAGFLGDHLKAALEIQTNGEIAKVNIFIKRLPPDNKPKTDEIMKSGYYKRERLAFTLFEELQDSNDQNPWSPKAYIYTDLLFVLSDLNAQGYTTRNYLETLDLPHVLLTASALAGFHAAIANYETTKHVGKIYSILEDHRDILFEPLFTEGPWLRTAAKLIFDFLSTFSEKFKKMQPISQDAINKLLLQACYSLQYYDETLNVLLHKDLWIKNIMYKYENGLPANAVLLDFQCLIYGPPAFDLMILLYFTTSRNFREKYEKDIFLHYYEKFCEALNDNSRQKLKVLNYDGKEFQEWCEKSRMFGLVEAMTILPFVLMDPKTAEKTFSNPETFKKHLFEDRSEPVINYAQKHRIYKEILLEVSEEFLERFHFKGD